MDLKLKFQVYCLGPLRGIQNKLLNFHVWNTEVICLDLCDNMVYIFVKKETNNEISTSFEGVSVF